MRRFRMPVYLLENQSSKEPPGRCEELRLFSSKVFLCIPMPHMTNDYLSQTPFYT